MFTLFAQHLGQCLRYPRVLSRHSVCDSDLPALHGRALGAKVCFLYPTTLQAPQLGNLQTQPASGSVARGGKDEPDLHLWGFKAQRTGVFRGQAEGSLALSFYHFLLLSLPSFHLLSFLFFFFSAI